MSTRRDHSDAWGAFWSANRDGGQDGGCLPARWQPIDTAQRKVWGSFARRLPKGARVLDLATGDGRVMGWLLKARGDLKLVGVDLAPELPPPSRGTKVKPGVAMERLPFPDGRFGAVVSQFGFEYGDVAAAARELGRVVRPGGSVGLMMHRGDGPILSHNLARAEQIGWALDERRLAAEATRALAARAHGLAVVPQSIAAAPAEGARLFGQGSAGWEIAEAIRRCLVMGARDHPANVARLIDTIVARAGNERGRIASLEAACATADDHAALAATFEAVRLDEISVEDVTEAETGKPFATFRTLRRMG